MTAPASLLAHGNEPVHGSRHRAAHEQQVALRVHPDDPEAQLGEAARPHVPRHPLPLDDARGVGPRGDGARLAVPGVAMGLGATPEVIAVHDALEAAALRDPGDLHPVARGEDGHRDLVARFGRFALARQPVAPVTWITGHGPAAITVTGTCAPSASNTRVMPSLRPIKPPT